MSGRTVNGLSERRPSGRLKIIVAGMIAGDPYQGGATWAVLQYLIGLRQLGHDVHFVEPVAAPKLRPHDAPVLCSANASYFREVMHDFGFESRSALLVAGTTETVGLTYARLDPGFNQLWHAAEGLDVGMDGHTHFATIGLALGEAACDIPTCGRSWITTRQPVVLSEWPRAERVTHDAFTTVANWRGYGSITYKSVFYGQKAHAWRGLMSLPHKSSSPIVAALAIHPGEERDLALLAANGWTLVDPAQVTDTPDRYRAFVQGSRGEIGVAKSGYAASRCGWFSDRSVCYLASGRPVVAQETGFSRFLPTGEGLFAFETTDDACAGIEAVVRDYDRHARRARAIAEEYFDASCVLPRLLERAGVEA
jgi:hypothetical protein